MHRSPEHFEKSRSSRPKSAPTDSRLCRLAISVVATCLATGVALHRFHREGSHSNSPSPSAATPPAPTIEATPISPNAIAAVDEPLPTPDASATDEQLLTLARNIVSRSPERAIAWARAQKDSTLRRRCLFAAIRAWGEREPITAVDWALTQDESERHMDIEAALAGAVQQPQQAVAIVRGLLKYYDPADKIDAAPSLVVTLNNAGEFQTALDFINDAPPDLRSDWTRATFQRWGASQPQGAIQALNSISDDKLRNVAFQALVDSWSSAQPATLADYAASLPDGADRTYALNKVVDNWSLQDPAAMATWLTTSPPGVDFDQAIAAMIAKTDSVNRSPEVALQWAENISDSDLKYDSIKRVLTEWNQTDPSAVQTYLATTSSLNNQTRQTLLSSLQPPVANNGN